MIASLTMKFLETMKNQMKIRMIATKISLKLIAIAMIGFILNGCQNEVKLFEPGVDQYVITEYIENNPDQFSEFGNMLQATGIENLLRVRGPFTLMLPTNDAIQYYYDSIGISSYTEIEMEDLKSFVYSHLIEGEITAGSIGQGSLLYKNGMGDYIASDLPGTKILLNKKAFIIKRDINVSNGWIHHIDHTLEPITATVFEVIDNMEGYEIFAEGLVKTGLSDTLNRPSFPYGSIEARTNFTLLAVPDTLYKRNNISTIQDLIAKYSDSDDLTDKENGFYKYMEFHCLSGTNYFTDFTPSDDGDIYYLISYENYLNIWVGKDYQINRTDTSYTGFYYDQSNVPAKNGVIHTVDDMLPAVDAEPTVIIFQNTDYFDLHQGDFYQNNYERFYDGQNTFEFIKWDAEYLMYYFKNEDNFMDADGLSLQGHWWIEITLPIIRKGTYVIQPWMFGGGLLAMYIDDVYYAEIDLSNVDHWSKYFPIEEKITFTETKTHKLKLKTLTSTNMWWDHIKLTPSN